MLWSNTDDTRRRTNLAKNEANAVPILEGNRSGHGRRLGSSRCWGNHHVRSQEIQCLLRESPQLILQQFAERVRQNRALFGSRRAPTV
jgi:hypothetical protein